MPASISAPTPAPSTARAVRFRPVEAVIELGLLGAAVFSIFVTAGIVYVLFAEAIPFFLDERVTLRDFLTDTQWTPQFADKHFGILPLVSGTLVTTAIALAVALPGGTVVSVWLSEFARPRLREALKPILELLSAVPTVVYGYFAISVVSPALQRVIPDLPLFNMLSAGLVMGLMIVPYVSSLSEDAMRAVPMLLREGSLAMGADRLTTSLRVVFPAALSGIGASYILAVSRAVGETMIVAIAAGSQPVWTFNPLKGGETLTAYIARVTQGDLPHGSLEYQTIWAAGLTLFFMTLGFNLVGAYLRRRYRQAY